MSENSNKKISQALGHTGDCPALDQLIEAISANNAQTQAHVARCAHCTAELTMLSEFNESAVRPEEQAAVDAIVARLRQNSPVPKNAWWRSLWSTQWLAPASVVLAALVVGLFVYSPSGTNLGPKVSGGEDAVRSARLEMVAPMGTILDAPSQLEWIAVKGAARYKVTLDEVDHTAVWSGVVEGPSAVLPADVRAKVVPRKTFNWQVLALDSNGKVIADSGSRQFRMEGPTAQ